MFNTPSAVPEVESGLCIVDPALQGQAGHFAAYVRSLRDEALARGCQVRVLGHRDLDAALAAELGAEPSLTLHHYDRRYLGVPKLGFFLDPILTSRVLHRDLKRVLADLDASWVVLMSTVDHRYLLAWAWWLLRRRRRSCPRLVLIFHTSYYDSGAEPRVQRFLAQTRYWARVGLGLLALVARRRSLRIGTDSERLAAEYRKLTSLPVEVFPIPHTPVPVGEVEGKGRLRFLLLGDSRPEKGFAVAMDAIRRLQADGQLEGLEFVVQCYANTSDLAEIRDRLVEGLDPHHVRLVPEVLEREAYEQLLAEADVVIVPYLQSCYRSRTSGPFTEALAAGKPVVTTEDTWMSEQLAPIGSGITFADQDDAALARAILQAARRHEELAANARAAAPSWRAFHNPGCLLDALT